MKLVEQFHQSEISNIFIFQTRKRRRRSNRTSFVPIPNSSIKTNDRSVAPATANDVSNKSRKKFDTPIVKCVSANINKRKQNFSLIEILKKNKHYQYEF